MTQGPKRVALTRTETAPGSSSRRYGFRLDADSALVGEATVPKTGLAPGELRERVRALVRARDLLEAHLTGKNEE